MILYCDTCNYKHCGTNNELEPNKNVINMANNCLAASNFIRRRHRRFFTSRPSATTAHRFGRRNGVGDVTTAGDRNSSAADGVTTAIVLTLPVSDAIINRVRRLTMEVWPYSCSSFTSSCTLTAPPTGMASGAGLR